jgi:GNAT superfamily N-acetyltransferase
VTDITLVEGWRPGALGFLIGEHARFYAREWQFGPAFEAKVAAGLGEFMARYRPEADRLLLAVAGDTMLGGLALDFAYPGGPADAARLRWFILSDAARGRGVGQRLMTAAIEHLDHHRRACTLGTFAGLDAARHLYERFGFSLRAETIATSWGRAVSEQEFRREAQNG